MSRITPPVTKFTHTLRRSISSSAYAGHPSSLLNSQASASRYLPRKLKDLKTECQNRGISKTGNKAEVSILISTHIHNCTNIKVSTTLVTGGKLIPSSLWTVSQPTTSSARNPSTQHPVIDPLPTMPPHSTEPFP